MTVPERSTVHSCGGAFGSRTDGNGGAILECGRCHAREPVVRVHAPRVEGATYREPKEYRRNLPKRLSEFYDHEP